MKSLLPHRIKAEQATVKPKKIKTSVCSGDWFGCGRAITQESWDGFIAARKAYWDKKDKQDGPKTHLERDSHPSQ